MSLLVFGLTCFQSRVSGCLYTAPSLGACYSYMYMYPARSGSRHIPEMPLRKLRGRREASIQAQTESGRTFGIYAHFHAPICIAQNASVIEKK